MAEPTTEHLTMRTQAASECYTAPAEGSCLAPTRRKTFGTVARDAVGAMRVYQWLKNTLVLVPAITSHQLLEPGGIPKLLLAFVSLSLCASAGYVINDLLDVEADRSHPTKQTRPFARAALSRSFGFAFAVLLCLIGIGMARLVSSKYALMLCCYFSLAIAYSVMLKTLMLVDVFMLAYFYTFRVYAGGEAAGVRVSFWLAAFSMFFFLSLAFAKRFVELKLGGTAVPGRRDYRTEDGSMLAMWGSGSGCVAVVVLAFYLNSPETTRLYHRPDFLWLLCVAVLFWLIRIWMLANRDSLSYDPILFAVRDRQSYLLAFCAAAAFALAL